MAVAVSLLNHQSLRQKVTLALQIAFAFGTLVLIWQIAGGEEALELLANAELTWLAAAVLILSLQTTLSALRWKITAGHLGIKLSLTTALSEYYLAQLVNQVLPGGIIGDASRAVRSRDEAGLLASGQAVIIERLSGQAGLVIVAVTTLGVAAGVPGGIDLPSWMLLSIAGFFGALTVSALTLIVLAKKTAGAFSRGLNSFGFAFRNVLSTPSSIGAQIGLSIGTAICNVAGFAFAAWAVGSSLNFLTALVLVPIILLAMLLPLTVGGWGLREGAAVALFPIAGLAAVEGLAASVAFGLVSLAVSLPGLFFFRSPISKSTVSDEALKKSK